MSCVVQLQTQPICPAGDCGAHGHVPAQDLLFCPGEHQALDRAVVGPLLSLVQYELRYPLSRFWFVLQSYVLTMMVRHTRTPVLEVLSGNSASLGHLLLACALATGYHRVVNLCHWVGSLGVNDWGVLRVICDSLGCNGSTVCTAEICCLGNIL